MKERLASDTAGSFARGILHSAALRVDVMV